MLHPVEELLMDPARHADEIVHWCTRTTGLMPTEPARTAAHALLRSGQLAGTTLRDLATLWKSDPQLDALVYEVEHVAVYVIEFSKQRRAQKLTAVSN